MPALAARTKAGLDFELAFDRGDNNVGLELGVSLQVGKVGAAIGTRGDSNRDNLVDVFGFASVGRRMVVRPAWRFGGTVLELVILFAERMRGAVLVPLLLAALLIVYLGLPHIEGRGFALMMMLEGFARYVLELIRVEPSVATIRVFGQEYGMSVSMILGLIVILAGAVMWAALGVIAQPRRPSLAAC